jgi:hypothetical protein
MQYELYVPWGAWRLSRPLPGVPIARVLEGGTEVQSQAVSVSRGRDLVVVVVIMTYYDIAW